MAKSEKELREIANKLRLDVIEMTSEAGSGHPGGSLSSADLMAVLYFRVMNHRPSDPSWDGRDRFILSKGHVAPILYASLAESGYFPVDELKTLRKINSRLQGHPVRGKVPGVEMSTGSLGQGLSMACGFALAAKMDSKKHRVYCLVGDGELQSGMNWEAAMFASQYKLSNLVVFVDRNRLQISGCTDDVMSIEPLERKWESFGWRVITIDGHNIGQIINACKWAKRARTRPTVVIMNTIKGKGVSFMENNAVFHGKSCNEEETVCAENELEEAMRFCR
ncbi:MAG: transketolase [Candidatus Methanomethylophilaceae archaeon]